MENLRNRRPQRLVFSNSGIQLLHLAENHQQAHVVVYFSDYAVHQRLYGYADGGGDAQML